jgi:hypothetical protein
MNWIEWIIKYKPWSTLVLESIDMSLRRQFIALSV